MTYAVAEQNDIFVPAIYRVQVIVAAVVEAWGPRGDISEMIHISLRTVIYLGFAKKLTASCKHCPQTVYKTIWKKRKIGQYRQILIFLINLPRLVSDIH